MTKEKKEDKISTPSVLPMNYEALEYISWFATDSQNLQNWASNIFRGGFSVDDSRLADLLNAANKSLSEVENDLVKIKEYLSNIPTPNNN
jgi:hypothetical protein